MRRTTYLTLGLLALAVALGAPEPARAGKAVPVNAPGAEAAPTLPTAPAAPAADQAPAVAAEHDEAAAEHGGQPNILEPQLPLAFWTLVVFLILLAVLWRFAWGPLAKALHDREHHLQHNLEEAERARTEAAALLAEHRTQMDQAHQQIQAMLDEARRDAQANADEIRRVAQTEAEATRQRAVSDIATARDQALTDIWSKTADLAVGIAGKVLQRELSPDDHRRLIDQAMTELPATVNNARGRHA
jgi:F-type H+-transporting ATPase subunit b